MKLPVYEAEKVILRKIAKELEEFNAMKDCEKIDLSFLIRACYETIQECEGQAYFDILDANGELPF